MHDPVQGKGLDHILNDLLTERAFGRVVEAADGETLWRWNGASVLKNPVAEPGEDEVSYGCFLRIQASERLDREMGGCDELTRDDNSHCSHGYGAVPHVGGPSGRQEAQAAA